MIQRIVLSLVICLFLVRVASSQIVPRDIPCWFYCLLPFFYLFDAVSQNKHESETTKVKIGENDVVFRKHNLFYYTAPDGSRHPKEGEMMRDALLPVGKRMVGFRKGHVMFHPNGSVREGIPKERTWFAAAVTLNISDSYPAEFYDDGRIMGGTLSGATKLSSGKNEFFFGPGMIQLYHSGMVKEGLVASKQVYRGSGAEVPLLPRTVAEFTEDGVLILISTLDISLRGFEPIEMGVGKNTVRFIFCRLYPDGKVKNGELYKPQYLHAGKYRLRFANEIVHFHPDGSVERGTLEDTQQILIDARTVSVSGTVRFRADGGIEQPLKN